MDSPHSPAPIGTGPAPNHLLVSNQPGSPDAPRPELIPDLWAAADLQARRVPPAWVKSLRLDGAYGNRKVVGERAELLFMFEAPRRGLIVSKPMGDSARYDVIVERADGPSVPYRVQVRYVGHEFHRTYPVSAHCCSHQQRLSPDKVDFLAAYIAPFHLWYIIPVRAFYPSRYLCLFPHKRSKGSRRYERFRSAWRLLRAQPPEPRSRNRK